MIANYLRILQESLIQKLEILSQIEKKSQEQAELLKSPEVTMQAIDANMDEKAALIEKIAPLDNGFDSLYEKIKEELLANKDSYKPQIAELQKLIASVTGKSTSIQAIEARNKVAVESFFREERKALQSKKNAMAAAQDYYQSMNKVKHVAPQFMDTKQ